MEDNLEFLDFVESKGLTEEQIKKIAVSFQNKDTHKLIESVHVNVLILGKTGVGKTTFFNCLKDPTIKAFKQSVVSQTHNVKLQPFTLHTENCNLTINLIDTPGLRESGLSETRSDQVITKCIIETVKRDITKIHLLVICVSTTERFTEDDYKTIKVLNENFCEGSDLPIIICITKSENRKKEWYIDRINEIKTHKYFTELVSKDSLHILFSGYVDAVNQTLESEEQLKKSYKFVYSMRKTFINRIIGLHKQNPVGIFMNVLPYYKKLEIDAGQLIRDFIQILIGYVKSAEQKENLQGKTNYLNCKKKVFSYNVFYDISVMSSHFALINDILSVLYNREDVKEEWIYEGFNEMVYKKQGSLTLKWNERWNNLPPVKFKEFNTVNSSS